ncbi:MAG: DUF6352 family protein [Pseudomonadota bacterium]
MRDFWISAGRQLLAPSDDGWLAVTPAFIGAYALRPEMHPIETSCDAEIALHAALVDDPLRSLDDGELAALQDADAVENYRVFRTFRDVLLQAGTVEAGYLALVKDPTLRVPAIFLDQLVHVILRHVLDGVTDPMRLRAAEIFFREQNVNTEQNRLMLADVEVVDMHAQTGGAGGLGQLLVESGTAVRSVELDVLDDDNGEIYWARSDRFDTVIDFRFGLPALDAFARVLEAWVSHLTRHTVRVQPRKQIDDEDWRWHIGLDRDGNDILNRLYRGEDVPLEDLARIVGLFQMIFDDATGVLEQVRGRPVYLALAMDTAKHVRMKPQNILVNLPVSPTD